jgi:hypothetical protein
VRVTKNTLDSLHRSKAGEPIRIEKSMPALAGCWHPDIMTNTKPFGRLANAVLARLAA